MITVLKCVLIVLIKQSRVNLAKGTYYCPFVKEILPNGMVLYDTDSTECVDRVFFEKITQKPLFSQ